MCSRLHDEFVAQMKMINVSSKCNGNVQNFITLHFMLHITQNLNMKDEAHTNLHDDRTSVLYYLPPSALFLHFLITIYVQSLDFKRTHRYVQ